jgi:acyl carrier protein
MTQQITEDELTVEVLGDVITELTEIIGQDYLPHLEVGLEKTFNDDLALESVDFVALSTALQQRYGQRVDIAAFIMDLDLEQMIELTVGDLVSFITTSLRTESPDARQPGSGDR